MALHITVKGHISCEECALELHLHSLIFSFSMCFVLVYNSGVQLRVALGDDCCVIRPRQSNLL